MNRKRTEELDARVRELHGAGTPIKKIISETGLSKTTIRRIMNPAYEQRQAKIAAKHNKSNRCLDCGRAISPNNKRCRRCAGSQRRKFSPLKAEEVLEMRESGQSIDRIARKHKTTAERVKRVLKYARQRRERKRGDLPSDLRRDQGCIVTFAHKETGELMVRHRWGPVEEALRVICARPDMGHVETISTYRTIMTDIAGYRTNNEQVDIYVTEKNLLGKIGRLDLLPPAASLSDRAASRQKRAKDRERLHLE